MFDALDTVVAKLLTRADVDGAMGLQVSFAAPDRDFTRSVASLPALSVFLYDIGENSGLRSDRWEHGFDGSFQQRRAPARVDCSYLITAWTDPTSARAVQGEHLILGAVLRELLRYRHLPAELLEGTALAGQPFPLPARVLGGTQLRSVGEFWQAMGGRPKATLHYGVTLAVDVGEWTGVGPPVIERPAVRLSTQTAP